MSLIGILITLAMAGFIVWIILQTPMPAIFRNIIIGVVAIVLVIWVLQIFGIDTVVIKNLRLR